MSQPRDDGLTPEQQEALRIFLGTDADEYSLADADCDMRTVCTRAYVHTALALEGLSSLDYCIPSLPAGLVDTAQQALQTILRAAAEYRPDDGELAAIAPGGES